MPARHRPLPPSPLPDDGLAALLPKLTAGISASGTFVILFFILYSKGVPPLDSFIVVLLGAGFMALLGYQLGKVLATAQPNTAPPTLPTAKMPNPPPTDGDNDDLLDDPLLDDGTDIELITTDTDHSTSPKA